MHHRTRFPLHLWLTLLLGVALLLLQSCAEAPSPTPVAAAPSANTLEPTRVPQDTPVPPTLVPSATATEASPTNTPPPTATPLPTDTPAPSATPLPTGTPTPTASPTVAPQSAAPRSAAPVQAAPAAPSAAGSASTGSIAAKPDGSSLFYEPEYPPVSPAGPPPTYGGNTNPLTGQHVDDAGLVNRRPILVRYGNDRAARPHAGIAQADIVMEDLMEAFWITRLTGVFLRNEPQQVGPVRSARPVNIELLPAFDGVFCYSGASIGVTQLLSQGSFDLIHEGHQGDLFYRGSGRPAPHNLYTSIPRVRERMRAIGWERPVSLRGLSFGDAAAGGAPASRVHIPLPPSSTVVWTWDAGAGVYRRWVQGVAYTDLLTGEQIGAQNVIVIYAKHWKSDIVEDSLGSRAIGIAVRGGERVQVFRDGQVFSGYWWRQDANMLFQLIDTNGQHIPLKPGTSWIQIVPTTYVLGIQ